MINLFSSKSAPIFPFKSFQFLNKKSNFAAVKNLELLIAFKGAVHQDSALSDSSFFYFFVSPFRAFFLTIYIFLRPHDALQ